jgi:hypothetical protein
MNKLNFTLFYVFIVELIILAVLLYFYVRGKI